MRTSVGGETRKKAQQTRIALWFNRKSGTQEEEFLNVIQLWLKWLRNLSLKFFGLFRDQMEVDFTMIKMKIRRDQKKLPNERRGR